MKKMIVMAMAAAMMCGCEASMPEESEEEPEWGGAVAYQSVTFDVSNAGWETATRGLVADGSSMTDLWLFDYVGGQLVKTVHKTQDDSDFDANAQHEAWRAHRTSLPVVVRLLPFQGNGNNMGTTLRHLLEIVAVDRRQQHKQCRRDAWIVLLRNLRLPSMTKFLMMLQRCALPLPCGTTGSTILQAVPLASSLPNEVITGACIVHWHKVQLVASIYGLSNTDEWTTDVTINAKDADGNSLGSAELQDAPFRRNMTTSASGNLFAGVRVFGLTLNDEWLDSQVIEW